jgi:hypothetical protein
LFFRDAREVHVEIIERKHVTKQKCCAATLGGRDCVEGDTQKSYSASIEHLASIRDVADKARKAQFGSSSDSKQPERLFDETRMDILVERVAAEVTKKMKPFILKLAKAAGIASTGDDDDDAKSAIDGADGGMTLDQKYEMGEIDKMPDDPAELALYNVVGVDSANFGLSNPGLGGKAGKAGKGKLKALQQAPSRTLPLEQQANLNVSSASVVNQISPIALGTLQQPNPKDARKWIECFRYECRVPTINLQTFYSRYRYLLAKCFFQAAPNEVATGAPDQTSATPGDVAGAESQASVIKGMSIVDYCDISSEAALAARQAKRDHLFVIAGDRFVEELDVAKRVRVQEDAVLQHLMSQMLKLTENYVPVATLQLMNWASDAAAAESLSAQSQNLILTLRNIKLVYDAAVSEKVVLQSPEDTDILEATSVPASSSVIYSCV